MEMSLGMCLVVDRKETAVQGVRLGLRWDLRTDLGADKMPFPNTSGDHVVVFSFSHVETILYRVERQ